MSSFCFFTGANKGTLVLIKTGARLPGDSISDKYLRLAELVRSSTDFSVLVQLTIQSTPVHQSMEELMEAARELAPEADRIYYIGISKGASIGAIQAFKYPSIVGMLLVNPTLMINWLKIKRGLELFSSGRISILIGKQDPSINLIGFLEVVDNRNLEVLVEKGQGHSLEEECLKDAVIRYLNIM
ncbi:MAG: hypothetical protein Q4D07_00355 [Selenomonadaceae bacterium]|nr:hypothetical protein [Selenomonadaceae bacterium]